LIDKLKNGIKIENIAFRDYGKYILQESDIGRKTIEIEKNENYLKMREKFNLPKYNNTGRGNITGSLMDQYGVVFETNLKTHGYKRIRKFLLNVNREKLTKLSRNESNKILYQNLHFLFNIDSEHIKTLNFELNWSKGYFQDLNTSPIKYLVDFYNISLINEEKKWKKFSIIPIYTPQRKHVEYGKNSFLEILKKANCYPMKLGEKGREIQVEATDIDWHKVAPQYFNLKHNKKFRGTFSTDGVTVCARYLTPKNLEEPSAKRIRPDLGNQNFDSFIGVDPGEKLFIGAVKEENGQVQNIKIKNRTYQYMNGHYQRKKKLKKLTSEIDTKIEADRQTLPNPPEQLNYSRHHEYVDFCLKWLPEKTDVYLNKKIARLKFDKYIRCSSTLSNLIRDVFGVTKNKKVAIFYGHAETSSNSPMKGHIRVPGRALKKKLQNHPNVTLFIVNEYLTTKLCSKDSTIMKAPPPRKRGKEFDLRRVGDKLVPKPARPHRWRFCEQCSTLWNRDVNAAKNILQLGIAEHINHLPRNKSFVQS
jgi:transposase